MSIWLFETDMFPVVAKQSIFKKCLYQTGFRYSEVRNRDAKRPLLYKQVHIGKHSSLILWDYDHGPIHTAHLSSTYKSKQCEIFRTSHHKESWE